MAQQTINVGAAPNDGTGTPLRTAFQYTNSNFSELYTAVGPSGNNIVVPGTATITGDLTVRTNKLAVTNTGVGIGTASPAETLTVAGKIRSVSSTFGLSDVIAETTASTGTGYARLIAKTADREWRLINDASTSGSPFIVYDATANAESLRIATAGVYTFGDGAGGTRMTLNATGLGVGVASPSFKLHVQENASNVIARFTGSNTNGSVIDIINTGAGGGSYKIGSNYTIGGAGEFAIYDSTAAATRLLISSSGNVGIGVTPSAWSAYKALQIGRGSFSSDTSSATAVSTLFGSNFVYDGNWKYIVAAAATFYQQTGGVHYWFNEAGTKAAGATFTPVQAMTLDASGNLNIGVTGRTEKLAVYGSSVTQALCLLSGNTAGDVSNSALVVSKFDNNTTTSQVFARFFVNALGSGSGQINANGASQAAFGSYSDSRLKENIVSLPSQLANILSLRPVEFDYKDGSGHQIGFVAQEMQEVYSDAVGEQKGFLTVTGWSKTEARLVSAIKELAAKVQALEAKLA